MAELFDPIGILAALERRRVSFIVIGGLGRVIHGSDELTHGIDIVPSAEENLRRLGLALDDLNASRQTESGSRSRPGAATSRGRAEDRRGELKIVPEPAGTRGYDDLSRAATREALGQGVRPSVASVADQGRMLAGLDREHDKQPLQTLRRLIEIQNSIRRGTELGI